MPIGILRTVAGALLLAAASGACGSAPPAAAPHQPAQGSIATDDELERLLSVRDGRSGWVRVDLPGDLSGWVEEATVERI